MAGPSCCPGNHLCARLDLELGSGDLDSSHLLEALDDESLVPKIQRRARLLQMMAECTIPTARAMTDLKDAMPESNGSFVTPLRKYILLNDQSRVITFKKRLHLVEAAANFDLDVARLHAELELKRQIRKRAKTSKDPGEPKDSKPELVLLREALSASERDQKCPDNPKKSLYYALIQQGRQLRWLSQHMGQNFLATLPCTAVYPNNARLQLPRASRCFGSLRQTIEPAKYVHGIWSWTMADIPLVITTLITTIVHTSSNGSCKFILASGA